MTTIYNPNINQNNTISITATGPTSYLPGYGAVPYTASGSSNTVSVNYNNQNFVSNNGKAIMTIPYDEQTVVLDEAATLDVKGTVRINGQDLEERLSTIEKVLCIPRRDVIMEHKHPKLKQLYEQYMHELEKYKTWDRVKGED